MEDAQAVITTVTEANAPTVLHNTVRVSIMQKETSNARIVRATTTARMKDSVLSVRATTTDNSPMERDARSVRASAEDLRAVITDRKEAIARVQPTIIRMQNTARRSRSNTRIY